MGIWDVAKKQLLDVIEWVEPDEETLAWRFPIQDREIQQGAQLTVRESQAALFVDEGRIADLFGPGRYRLVTQNLPILTTLKSWPFGFESPFKSDVYFFSKRQKLGQRWGTPQPIAVRDRELGSVQLRMFGTFSYHVDDVRKLHLAVSGTRERFTTEELAVQLIPLATAAAAALFAGSQIPFLDLAANQVVLSGQLQERLQPRFAELGVALDQLVVESVTLPPELQEALVQRQSMGIVGDLGRYAQYQVGRSIPDAARNEGGLAGAGAGLAAGAAIGQVMAGALGGLAGGGAPSAGGASAARACVGCGKPIGAADAFCKHCGKPQARTCPSCGTTAEADAAFCAKCGTKLP